MALAPSAHNCCQASVTPPPGSSSLLMAHVTWVPSASLLEAALRVHLSRHSGKENMSSIVTVLHHPETTFPKFPQEAASLCSCGLAPPQNHNKQTFIESLQNISQPPLHSSHEWSCDAASGQGRLLSETSRKALRKGTGSTTTCLWTFPLRDCGCTERGRAANMDHG